MATESRAPRRRPYFLLALITGSRLGPFPLQIESANSSAVTLYLARVFGHFSPKEHNRYLFIALPIVMPPLSTSTAADRLLFENYIRMNDYAKCADELHPEDIGEMGAIWPLPDRPHRLAASFAS